MAAIIQPTSFGEILQSAPGAGIFGSAATQATVGLMGAERNLKFQREQNELERKFTERQNRLDREAKREMTQMASGQPPGMARKFALLLGTPALKNLAEAFQQPANAGADLLKHYQVLAQNRESPFQVVQDALTYGNNYQRLTHGMGANVLDAVWQDAFKKQFPNVNPFYTSPPTSSDLSQAFK